MTANPHKRHVLGTISRYSNCPVFNNSKKGIEKARKDDPFTGKKKKKLI